MEYILVAIVIAIISIITHKLSKTHPTEALLSIIVTIVITLLFSSSAIALLVFLVAYLIFLSLHYKAPPSSITKFAQEFKSRASRFDDL